MKPPYNELFQFKVRSNFEEDKWCYGVKYTRNGACYIGSDADHITIISDVEGFHHSVNTSKGHEKGRQHLGATTLQLIIDHISANSGSYKQSKMMIEALQYIINANAQPVMPTSPDAI